MYCLLVDWLLCLINDRKQDLREMKILQRQEMKEATEFFNKITSEREAQDKKLETEQQVGEEKRGERERGREGEGERKDERDLFL